MGDDDPFILVARSVYGELMAADLRERGLSEIGTSAGSEMRRVLIKYIPHEKTDALPNPVRVVVKASDDGFPVEIVQQWRRP